VFREKISVDEIRETPPEYQELVTRLLTIQADCEIASAHIYGAQWLVRAPSADDMYQLARMIAEEIDHYRRFNRLLKQIHADGTHLLWRENSERYLDALKVKDLPTWADVIVFSFLIDRVGKYQLEEFLDSTYLPLNETTLLPVIISEETQHIAYGHRKLIELSTDPKGKAEVQRALERWFPLALDMFGRSNSRRCWRYLEWGLKRRTNAEARRDYVEEVNPLLAQIGLEIPDESAGRKYL
jgi:ring-1,2-phenylacetyl-CoA epoxidase subunit PaaA